MINYGQTKIFFSFCFLLEKKTILEKFVEKVKVNTCLRSDYKILMMLLFEI